MKKRFLLCLPIVLLFSFFSCSDATPELILASGSMVFDYEDEESFPRAKMAVFVQMDSEVQRADRLELESRVAGYNWRIDSPKLFRNGDKKWAYYTNILPPAHEMIPDGIYDFRYVDAAGEEALSSFMLSYPRELVETKAADVRSVLPAATESIALYDKNNVLVFFGKARNNWTTNVAILRDFNNAIIKRRCLSADNNRIICLMPEESLLERRKSTAEEAKPADTEDDDSDE